MKSKKFRNAVTNNTVSLLNESRELKANTRKIEYQEKVQNARYLIDYYIIPLNTILDINHSQSIYNELLAISQSRTINDLIIQTKVSEDNLKNSTIFYDKSLRTSVNNRQS